MGRRSCGLIPLTIIPLTIVLFLLIALTALRAGAQIQQAWVAHYNNGIPEGTHQAVKVALDSAGNIYVTGASQGISGSLKPRRAAKSRSKCHVRRKICRS